MSRADHAPVAPSSLNRTVQCPGSLPLSQLYPEPEDSPEAMEGAAAHWALEQALRGWIIAEGQIAPNGVVLTDEMVDGAEMAVDYVRRHAGHAFLSIEHHVAVPRIHAQCWGTPDVRAWAAPTILHVFAATPSCRRSRITSSSPTRLARSMRSGLTASTSRG